MSNFIDLSPNKSNIRGCQIRIKYVPTIINNWRKIWDVEYRIIDDVTTTFESISNPHFPAQDHVPTEKKTRVQMSLSQVNTVVTNCFGQLLTILYLILSHRPLWQWGAEVGTKVTIYPMKIWRNQKFINKWSICNYTYMSGSNRPSRLFV